MKKVGLLLTLCSRGQKYREIGDTDIISIFLEGFLNTAEQNKYEYHFYLGYDDDDQFYIDNIKSLQLRLPNCVVTKLTGCQGNPCKAWNDLLKEHWQECEYFYQVGTDIRLLTGGWTTYFINTLKKNGNIGIIGGVDKAYWYARTGTYKQGIIENAFFHRTQYKIFGYLFHPKLKNWFSDDYISEVYYNNNCCFISPYVLFRNTNRVCQKDFEDRYIPDMSIQKSIGGIIEEDTEKLKRYRTERNLLLLDGNLDAVSL